MRTIAILLVALILHQWTIAQEKTSTQSKLEIYYFHSLKRCPTCISIEENTKKVLSAHFKKEVDAGIIKLHVLCCDDEKNKALVDKYGAYGSSLILQSKIGKMIKDDVTNFAFSYSKNNPDKFKSGLKEKIEKIMK